MLQIDAPQANVRFGVARRDITPPVGIDIRLWPRAKVHQATGVHRPLTATAVVLQNPAGDGRESDEQVVVALDLLVLLQAEQEALLAEVRHRTGVGSGLLLHCSHTHSTGWVRLDHGDLPGGEFIRPYLDHLAAEISLAVAEARTSAQPASVVFGQVSCDMAGNRDLWDVGTGQFVCGYNPDGPFDPTVLVGRVTGSDGRLLATLVNYACHPTTLAWDNSLISPDFPGAMREVVELATGAPCVFLQGASGDTGPREGFVGDPAVADRNGRQLGYAALQALESIPGPGTTFRFLGPSISGTTLGLWGHVAREEAVVAAASGWSSRRWTVPLAYRTDMGSVEDAHTERERWLAEEAAAGSAGDAVRATDARAKAEQAKRLADKLGLLPPGQHYPFPVQILKTGSVFWVAVEAEHYNILQRELRRRVPDAAVVVMTLVNGGRVAYLPTADTYGKGLYQETIAVLAPGSLEQLIEQIAAQLAAWTPADGQHPVP